MHLLSASAVPRVDLQLRRAYSEKRSSLSQKKSQLDLAFDAVATLLPDPEPFPLVLESQDA